MMAYATEKVSRILTQQALTAHRVLSDSLAYVEPLTEEEFISYIRALLDRQIPEATEGYSAFFSIISKLDRHIEHRLSDRLKRSPEDILAVLLNYSLSMDQELRQWHVYYQALTPEAFRSRVIRHLEDLSARISGGKEGFAVSLVVLPTDLLAMIEDAVPCVVHWDYEFGYRSFFAAIAAMVEHAELSLHWQYEPASKGYFLTLGSRTFALQDVPLGSEIGMTQYRRFTGWLSQGLQEQHLALLEPATGDQTGAMLLVPPESVPSLAKYFVTEQDVRIRLVYPPEYHHVE